eukprot:Skav204831  [mRNA]  locus=scaffold2524:26221:27325:+ [translate_table: standard]
MPPAGEPWVGGSLGRARPKHRKGTDRGDFGRKAATMLSATVDPRKDLVRQQRSRFESAAELERSAKRMRRLNELEQMDAVQEQMEELKQMKAAAAGAWWSWVAGGHGCPPVEASQRM